MDLLFQGILYRENIELFSGTSATLTRETVSKMTTSAEYITNWNTSFTAQENLIDDLSSSCAIMTKVIVVLVSVGGV
jgi:hypothetical protein